MHFNTVAKHIRRSPYQAILAILIMTFTFYTISVFAIRTVISVKLISYFESKPQVTIFFNDTVKKENISDLKNKLEGTGKTLAVEYVSKEKAFNIYKNLNKEDPLLLELVTSELLPDSLEVKAIKPEYLSELASEAKGLSYVGEVIFQKETIDTFVSWIDALKRIGVIEISILLVESVLIVLTIISIRIGMRKEEIEIMKLIGASNWFIRIPFLLEGMFYGVLGAMLGWSFSYIYLLYFTPMLQGLLKGIPIFPLSPLVMLDLLGLEIIIACILGLFASYIAVLRYIK